MRQLIIAVTGASGSGKSTFAGILKDRLRKNPEVEVIEINDIINRYKLYSGKDKFGTKIVNPGRLTARVKREIKGKRVVILVGHLAPDLTIRYDISVVTRCGLQKLAKRLERRKYPKEKIKDNLVAEAVDYCGVGADRRSKECYEVETDAQKRAAAAYIIAVVNGKRSKKPSSAQINHFGGMLKMIKRGNVYGF